MIPPDVKTFASLVRHRFDTMSLDELVLGTHHQHIDQLDAVSCAIAAADEDPLRPIAVLMDIDADGYLTLLAAVASGRPVVPLDVNATRELLESRLGPSDCCGIVSPASLAEKADTFDLERIDSGSNGRCAAFLDPEPSDPAVICFTSGSTGQARAFARTQGGLLVLGRRRTEARGLTYGHREMLCMSPLFVGMLNNFTQIIAGGGAARLLSIAQVPAERLLEVMCEEEINFIPLVPTLFRQIVHVAGRNGLPESLTSINLSGELMTRADLRGWLGELPSTVTIHVSYGSTESGTLTIHPVTEASCQGEGPLELGTPLPGVEISVIDDDEIPCESGTVGWVHARSPHEAIPFGRSSDQMGHVEVAGRGGGWLPMGDRGFINERGSLVVLGRADGEVKVAGIRFDPHACESSIRTVDGVLDAVIVLADRDGCLHPVAYVIAEEEHLPAIRSAINGSSAAGSRVRIEIRTSLPSTATGKVDRGALKKEVELWIEESESSGSGSARNPLESMIQDVWINHLKIKNPPVDRSFLELGGTSLGFISTVIELKERCGVVLPSERLAELDTIELQAGAATVDESSLEEASPLVEFSSGQDEGDAYLLLPGLGGHVWAFKPLWESLEATGAGAGLDWSRVQDFDQLVKPVQDWAASRPLTIIGFSVGCSIAGELVARLESSGVEVRRLISLDGGPAIQRPSIWKRVRQWKSMRQMEGPRELRAHFQSLRKLGRSMLRQVSFDQLNAPVRLVLSRESAQTLPERWREITTTELVRCDVQHLDLVRYPVPRQVSRAIISD